MKVQESKKNAPNNTAAKLRAERLKRIRNLANLSREGLCANTDINQHTLSGWENARFGGLSKKGAAKVVARVKQEGVLCSAEWLMDGTGAEPSVNPISSITANEGNHLSEEETISFELEFFKAKNSNAISLVVDDEGMLPHYQMGDTVAGKEKQGNDIQLAVGHDCIVKLESGEILFRNLRQGKDDTLYTLVCSNLDIATKHSILADIKLASAAPIIWWRRKES